MKIIWNHSSSPKSTSTDTSSNIALPKPNGQWIEDSETETETFFDTQEHTDSVPSQIHVPEPLEDNCNVFPFKRLISMNKSKKP